MQLQWVKQFPRKPATKSLFVPTNGLDFSIMNNFGLYWSYVDERYIRKTFKEGNFYSKKSFQNLNFLFSVSKKCSTNCQHNVYLIGNVVGNKVGGCDGSGCECSSKGRSSMTSLKYLRS